MILQKTLPLTPWADAPHTKLPGMQPVALSDVLQVDEAYAAQMAHRDALLAERRDAVYHHGAPEASAELLEFVLKMGAFERVGSGWQRSDGVVVEQGEPLLTAGRLVQEDLVILDQQGVEHALVAAVLCFPASWQLSEKAGHGLERIHAPVEEYDGNVQARVQRLFDGLQVGRPLMRANWLLYEDAELFQPRSENARRDKAAPVKPYVRVERQTILRLPVSRAVVFFIHTYVVRRTDLSARQERTLLEALAAG